MKATANNNVVTSIPFDPTQPPHIWALASPKGGPGKTTLAVALGAELERRAAGPVRLGDLDYTSNAAKHLLRAGKVDGGITLKGEHIANLVGEPRLLATKLTQMAEAAHFLILDTPGSIENLGTQTALRVADVIIFPVSPSMYDFEATKQALKLLETIALNPAQLSIVVVNKPEKTKVDQQMQEALAKYVLNRPSVYLAQTVVRKAVGFKESAANGMPLWSLGASGRNPTADIVALCDEIISLQQEHLNGQ